MQIFDDFFDIIKLFNNLCAFVAVICKKKVVPLQRKKYACEREKNFIHRTAGAAASLRRGGTNT